MSADIVPVEVQARASEIEKFVATYENYAVETADKYQTAALDVQAIKSKFKELDDKRHELTDPLQQSKDRIMEWFRRPLEALKNAELAIKQAMSNWQIDQENKRKIEQARLNSLAQKEEARKRAEKERQEAEWRAKQAVAQAEADKLAAKGKAEEAAKAQATADAAAAKAAERAQQAAAVQVTAPVVAKVEVKASGIQMREVWKFRIVDVTLIPRELMIPDEKTLGEIARCNKSLAKVAGVEFYNEPIIAAGSR